ncbi:hypothetical protein BH10PSE17_BH10PSE17_02400 [soil metagenome]
MKLVAMFGLVLGLSLGTPDAAARETIVTEGIIDAPVDAVWNAWTTADGLETWLAPNVDIDLRIDGLMRVNYDPGQVLGGPSTIENRIMAYELERMLSIRVTRAPDGFPFIGRIGEMWTVLYFQPTADGRTSLRVVGMGFGSDAESQQMKAFFIQGNAATLVLLQKRFARR